MRPERWAEIENIVHAAIDCAPEDRSSQLDRACGADTELRREVESLLSSSRETGFTGRSGFVDAMKILENHDVLRKQGRLIGAYRIVREIGRGGMGTVYQATRADDAFKKTVAIKIIRRGLDTDDTFSGFAVNGRFWRCWTTPTSRACWMPAARTTACLISSWSISMASRSTSSAVIASSA